MSRLNMNLTGKDCNRTQAIAIRLVRSWMQEIPYGDSIVIKCESAEADKQFRIWSKWFKKHEDLNWGILKDEKAFIFYRSRFVE